MKPVLLYQTDCVTAVYNFNVTGVYTNRRKLNSRIRRLIKAGEAMPMGDSLKPVSKMTLAEINDSYALIYVKQIELNLKIQP